MSKKLIIMALLLIAVLIGFALYWHSLGAPAQKTPSPVDFLVEKGQGISLIAENLRSAGLIKSDLYFKFYVWRTENQAVFKAGEYVLNSASSVEEIASILAGGKTISREKEIKILEGWNIADIDKYLTENDISGFADLARGRTGDWNFSFAKPQALVGAPASADLEGFLFPDTYRVFNDAAAEDVIEKMAANLDKKLGALSEEIAAQGKTPYEILIMASIIEKEVNKEEDKAIVSGILRSRLELGMPLGVDSTINYITGKKDPQANYGDLNIDSPYNTYKYRGLPPGPICNPGLSSIKAAVYPAESPYLYYLNRQDTGETIFSKTYDEHLANKRKYLK